MASLAQDWWKRSLPQAGYLQLEARQHCRVIRTIRLQRSRVVALVTAASIKPDLATCRVDQPILWNTGRFVLDELLATVSRGAFRRDDLHHQVGGTIEIRLRQTVGVLSGQENDVWLSSTRACG